MNKFLITYFITSLLMQYLQAQTNIGISTYQLQTNYSVCRRVFAENNGTVHATWTRSINNDAAAADRGTGYNVSADNGVTWGPAPSVRLEGSLRTGWPNVGVSTTGRIFSITHAGGQGLNFCYKNPGGNWTNYIVGTELGDVNGLWPRAANDGNNIHAVISRQNGIGSNIPGGLLYFRSLDGGDTWEGPFDLPNLNQYFVSLPADCYAIDVSGSTVAISIGQNGSPLVLYKSVDNGNTWQITVVQNTSNPYIFANTSEGQVLDLALTSAGQMSVLIDNNGKVHLWTDRVWAYKKANQSGGPFYLNYSGAALQYWNEDMESSAIIGQTVRQDYDQNDTTLLNGSEIFYGQSMVGQPSAGIDSSGNLYVAYSSMNDGDTYLLPNMYRDIFLIKSTDDGATWQGPYNASQMTNIEDVFPSIARHVNDKVHLIWHSQNTPGISYDALEGPDLLQNVYYRAVAVEDITTPDILVSTPPLIIGTDTTVTSQYCPFTTTDFLTEIIDYPDGDITGNITISGIDETTPGIYTVALSVTDSEGNTTISDPIVAVVLPDTITPAVAGNPAQFIYLTQSQELILNTQFEWFDTTTVLLGSIYDDLGAIFWDASDNLYGCPVTLSIIDNVNTNELGTYQVQYFAEDVAGNISDTVTRVVEVITSDLTPPQIVLYDYAGNVVTEADALFLNVTAGGIWEEPGFMAYDNVDGFLTDNVVVGGDFVDIEYIGNYAITYTVSDGAGNETSVTRVVSVQDSQAPVITLTGPPTVTVPCSTDVDFTSPTATLSGAPVGFTSFDNVDGNITNNVVVNTGGFCQYCSGTYTITYNVSDAAGNAAIQRTRTVIVLAGCAVDCDGVCDGIDVGIEDRNLDANVAVFPSPSKGTVNVTITNVPGMADVRVYNTTGQLLNYEQTATGTLSLNLSQYAAGMYFVEVTTQQGTVTKSVVVEK